MPTELSLYTVSLSALLKTTQSRKLKDLLTSPLAEYYRDTPLERLYKELFNYFPNPEAIEFDPSTLRIEVALLHSRFKNMADQMLNCSYSSRYWDHNMLVDIADQTLDDIPVNTTLVAVQNFGGSDIVLGTLRVTWDNLEVFQLFQIMENERWSHQVMSQKFGEVGRFCMHPLLDLLSNSALPEVRRYGHRYRVEAFRKIMASAMELLQEKQIKFLYYIASPRVQKFVEEAGITFMRVESVVPHTSSTVQALREQAHRYFKPFDLPENQPQVYYGSTLPPSR